MTSLKDFLRVTLFDGPVKYQVRDEETFPTYRRLPVEYMAPDDDLIPAYLFIPEGTDPKPAVLVHHQHNSERHLGKSEVAGLKGSPLQAFGPALARRGFVVLAPDSVCFEDRRANKQGTEPDEGERDWLQHFNELTYRLVKGDTLMRKVLDDASVGLSLLHHLPFVDLNRLGILGHSYGGNTVLFQAALDSRVKFACSSGAVCSYEEKMRSGIPFEFALTIPGFVEQFDFYGLVGMIAPRRLLVSSATEDKYSKDAEAVVERAMPKYERAGAAPNLRHERFEGGHALTEERFRFIEDWICSQ